MFRLIKIVLSFLLPVVILFAFTLPASAHFPQADGAITVILHVNPNDDPIIGQPATLLFDVSDDDNRFQAANCDCDIIVSENGKQLVNDSPQQVDKSHSIFDFQVPFVFPQPAIYHIVMTGAPKNPGSFQKFSLAWDFRADRQGPNAAVAQTGANNLKFTPVEYIAIGGSLLIGAIGAVTGYLDERKSKLKK